MTDATPETISYAAWGERFFTAAVTAERVVAGVGPREESPMAEALTGALPAALEAELEATARRWTDDDRGGSPAADHRDEEKA